MNSASAPHICEKHLLNQSWVSQKKIVATTYSKGRIPTTYITALVRN